ncbi:hypothetical protein AVEN_260244-1, partial [Araneus ventricosus]
MAPDSKSDPIEDPSCMGPVSVLNHTWKAKHPLAGVV